jgi:phosphoglycolate phosphatase-like HAD superfamily hydrolase
MAARYVIFDLDDTLVHSGAVRLAFCQVALGWNVGPARVEAVCETLPGRPACEIFEALGLGPEAASAATDRFFARLDELNAEQPAVPYPDAEATLRALRDAGAHMILSTGSPATRAQRVLAEKGWRVFDLVLGSGPGGVKGPEHFTAMASHLRARSWTERAVAVGDSPADMRLAAEHGVPVRIGVDRRAHGDALRESGATHVVRRLADVVPIIAAA